MDYPANFPYMGVAAPGGDFAANGLLPLSHVDVTTTSRLPTDVHKLSGASQTGELGSLPAGSVSLAHLPKEKFSDGVSVSHFTLSLRSAQRRVYHRTAASVRRQGEPSLVSLLNWSFSAPPPPPVCPLPDTAELDRRGSSGMPRPTVSRWQNVGGLCHSGVWARVSALLQDAEGGAGSGRPSTSFLSARLVCRSWYAGMQVQRMAAATSDLSCERRLLGGELCDKTGVCLCKLHRFRGLTHLDVDLLLLHRPALFLAAIAHLPLLSSLSLSVSSEPEEGEAFPVGLCALNIYGATPLWLDRVARLPRLTSLGVFCSPRFSVITKPINSIEPLKRLSHSLRALCVECSPAWDDASFEALASLTELTELTLKGFSPRCLHSITNLHRLRSLELSVDCEDFRVVAESSRRSVLPPPSIESLALEISSGCPQQVARVLELLLPYQAFLHSIELTNCSLSEVTVNCLAAYVNLESLFLQRVDAHGSMLRYLHPLAKLKTLQLDGVLLNEHTLPLLPSSLRHLSQLHGLTMDPCDWEPTAATALLEKVLSALPRLTSLQIQLTSESLIACPNDRRTAQLTASLSSMLQTYPDVDWQISASS